MKILGSKKEDGTGSNKGRLILIICLAVVAALLVLAVVGMYAVNRLDTIYPKVTMDGIDLGGMTKEQAAETLRAAGYDEHTPTTVRVAMPADCVLTLSSDDVCTYDSADSVAYLAYSCCRMDFNALTYVKCLFGGMKLESLHQIPRSDRQAIQAAVESMAKTVSQKLTDSGLTIGERSITLVKGAQNVEIDCEEMTEMIIAAFKTGEDAELFYEGKITPNQDVDVQEIYDSVHTLRRDAVFSKEEGIQPEVVGVSFDINDAQKRWNDAKFGETVEIPLTFDEPKVTAAELEKVIFRDKLSERATSLSGSTSNRINNVKRAAESINDTILMPGDEFDYNQALGKRTKENGYLTAGAYSGGQTVQEYGGGICQVSSTLYYCCLYANLQIKDRTCHMFPVNYLPAGLDATVSWGGPEYKFVNNREYPIKIVAWVDEEANTVNVELWGTDTDGSYVEMNYSTWFVFDETYPDVKIGYKAQTYRSVFDKDGTLLSRKAEALSFYGYHDEDIEWPQAVLDERARAEAEARGEPWPPEETVEPTESPEPTEEPEPTENPLPSEEPTESPSPTEEPGQTPIPDETPEPTDPVGEE